MLNHLLLLFTFLANFLALPTIEPANEMIQTFQKLERFSIPSHDYLYGHKAFIAAHVEGYPLDSFNKDILTVLHHESEIKLGPVDLNEGESKSVLTAEPYKVYQYKKANGMTNFDNLNFADASTVKGYLKFKVEKIDDQVVIVKLEDVIPES